MVDKIKAVLALGVIALALGALLWIDKVIGATPKSTSIGDSSREGSIDFDAAVGLALRQSPFFTKSSLEIDIRRLDETDSRFAFIPSITVRTRYFVNQPTVPNINPRAYSVEFRTEEYNPIEAYVSLKARKLFTRIAIMGHLQVISRGLQRLAQGFLQLDNLNRLALIQEKLVRLAEKNLTYAQERLKLGEATSLEVRLASQELALAQLEKKRLTDSQANIQTALRSFLGLKADQPSIFNLRSMRAQVLGTFDAATASLEKAQSRSFELKIQALKKELQAWNISLAKARLWREAMEQLGNALSALNVTQAQEELAKLNARQSYIRYQAGEPLAISLAGRTGYVKAQKRNALKALEYDLAILGVRYLSGDLVYQYVDEASWKK
jgi:outer membrane protein TolC